MSIQRAALSVLILPVLAVAVLRPAAAEPSMRVLEPASTGGVAELDRALARLTTHRRMLIIAAHPDDEDNRLLALVARGQGGEAAYFSLSRGEGGQNLIGEELGVGLGILRSRELLAARHVDGGRQFFSRAYDFGYTRSLAETFARWPRDELLVDAVRAVRRFKPQVVVAIFPPDRRAGHGQHQASAVIAREAFDRAGDAGAFPELRAEGLLPWSPQAFYRAAWWDPDAAGVTLPLGGIDPASGRSIFQLAMASRSQHRSQDMGLLQPLGDAAASLLWEAGAGAEGDDLWSGIDVRLEAIAAPLAPGPLARATR
ncbi:MAG: PIG-L family deacetylase, partial [Acidobacteria bacterium]